MILIYIVFIVLIILIALYYQNNNRHLETFADDNTSSTTSNQLDINMGMNSKEITNELLKDIQFGDDISSRNLVVKNMTELIDKIKQYATLDIPINITNNGVMCGLWGNFENGKYREKRNQCIVRENKRERECIDLNGVLSSCSKFYNNNFIDNQNTINILPLLLQAKSKLRNKLQNINQTIKNKNDNINTVINDLITKLTLEEQQKIFLNNYENDITSKNKEFEKLNKQLDNNNINLNKNKLNFSKYSTENNNNEYITNLYKKILFYLIIIIIIIGICNIAFTNILN